MEHNMIGWFEIPVTDMDRAKAFYEAVFQIDIHVQDFNGVLMGWFPWAEGKSGSSGSLIKQESYKPHSEYGVLIYFSSADVKNEVNRVEAAGGKVLKTKTQISPDVGYMGLFLDTEGNRVALHSRQ
ncbi:MAG: VOC family protein [Bacteroidia bacterium]|nr:VOC family protein [Bacteroidia bacterium]MBT8269383.1 VOC family protein [Bacteroidia bacterium]NNF81210.1 VOC family protein [Flavobacteriaceae bacterium]NNK69906.1 VOC family protein [Flavobacteriaceae bacterium]NNL80662.1 VOC family protein [Flavobacteriaceae bacterium]